MEINIFLLFALLLQLTTMIAKNRIKTMDICNAFKRYFQYRIRCPKYDFSRIGAQKNTIFSWCKGGLIIQCVVLYVAPACPTKLTGLYRTVSTSAPCASKFTLLKWTKMAWDLFNKIYIYSSEPMCMIWVFKNSVSVKRYFFTYRESQKTWDMSIFLLHICSLINKLGFG